MANQTIVNLPQASTPLSGAEVVWAVQNGSDVRISTAQLYAGTVTSPSFATINIYGSITASANIGAINYGTLTYNDTNVFSSFKTSVNSYAQTIVQNGSSGAGSSADIVVSNDQGTATTYYGNFGINSSGFSGTGSLNLPNATYLTSTSGDLVIGTTTNNTIRFNTWNYDTDFMTISPLNGTVMGNYANVVGISGGGSAIFNIAAGSAAAEAILQFGYGGLSAGGGINTNTWSIATGFGGVTNDMTITQGGAGGLWLRSNGNVGAGVGWTQFNLPSCTLTSYGSFGANPPSVYTSTTPSVTYTARSAIFNPSGTATVTLPAAATYPGMEIMCKNISAFAINSASSNVVPLNSATAGTTILPASAGSACILVSDGTNWQIMR